MGNQDQAFLFLFVDLLKPFDQHRKAPKINTGLRLIKNADLVRFRQYRCNLQTLHLASGKCAVHLSVQIIGRTKSHCRKQLTAFCLRQVFSRCKRQHSCHRHALKAWRLLECIADSRIGTMIDIVTGNILFIQENQTLIRFLNACQHLGQRRLTAAVRPGNH